LPDGFSVRRIPQSFSSHQPHNIRKETFTMQGSVFEVYVENSNRERKIIRTDIDGFKRYALELQKHETAMKNIILERK
jgi:urease accessory protein UreE